MDILVVHTKLTKKERKTIRDYNLSFSRYTSGHRFFYLDLQDPRRDLPASLLRYPFDAVIFTYTFFAVRYNQTRWAEWFDILAEKFAPLPAVKIMCPQDCYHYTRQLWRFSKAIGADHIFTIIPTADLDTVYPQAEIGRATRSFVFPGYVDDKSRKLIEKLRRETPRRTVDIGYRARRLPYWQGRLAQQKAAIADRFNLALGNHPGLATDISTTGELQNVYLGDDWFRFLLRCRTMLGTPGGCTMMDPDGLIVACTEEYTAAHPDAGFDETEAACFAGQDGKIDTHVVSPRHFECALTHTCQVLLEADYGGIFLPGVHYIEVKKDYSNLEDVLRQIEDEAHCERIAQRCYSDIAAVEGPENPNTYAWFANHVMGFIAQRAAEKAPGTPAKKVASPPRAAALHLSVACRAARRKISHFLLDGFLRPLGRFFRYLPQKLYYALCNFSARHPGLRRFFRRSGPDD